MPLLAHASAPAPWGAARTRPRRPRRVGLSGDGQATDIHTSAQAFGKIMSTLKPRHAVAYHFFNEEKTRYAIYDAIRMTYDGPLSMADDMMVWNITRDGIRERMAVSADDAWDVAGPTPPPLPEAERGAPIHWPRFRGADASGIGDGQGVPSRWDAESGENVRWKTPIPSSRLRLQLVPQSKQTPQRTARWQRKSQRQKRRP